MFWVIVAPLYFVLAAVAPSILGLFVNRARPNFRDELTSLAPAWNSRTAVIENHADNRYWERQNGVENRAVSA